MRSSRIWDRNQISDVDDNQLLSIDFHRKNNTTRTSPILCDSQRESPIRKWQHNRVNTTNISANGSPQLL